MNNSKKLEKYQINQEDWENIDLVNMKMKAESVVSLFLILENILAPHISPFESEMIENTKTHILEYLDKHFVNLSKEHRGIGDSLPLTLRSVKRLKRGDVFLWRSGMAGRYEIHTFHSDAGYGVKTFTDYNEKDGSSMLVNWSGVCGVLAGNDR